MGHKVCPIGLRIGISEDWRSRWYADKKNFGNLIIEDQKVRNFIKKNYRYAGIPKIEIERTREDVRIIMHTARPGLIIGRRGAEIERLRTDLELLLGRPVKVAIVEVGEPETNAQLVAEGITEQLERRMQFRRVMRRAVDLAMAAGAEGIKIQLAGRIGGVEMSRREKYIVGRIPLHTLRGKIDYGFSEALTTSGRIGCKVWIYKGEVPPETHAPLGTEEEKEVPQDAADAQKGEVPKVAETPGEGQSDSGK